MNRRGMVLGLAVAAYVLSFFHRVAPAAIAQDLAAAFQISGAALGSLAATYFYIYTLMQVPTGILADTLGPRKILFLGGLVAGGGSLLFGLAPSFEMAFVGRALVGLGVSVSFIAMLKLIAIWYEESRFATITGLCMLVGNLGSIAAGAPLAWLIQVASWREIFVTVGILSLIIGIVSLFLVKDAPGATPGLVARLLDEHRRRPHDVIFPQAGGRTGHPVLLPARVFPALMAFSGEGGVRAALGLDGVPGLPWPDPRACANVGTPGRARAWDPPLACWKP